MTNPHQLTIASVTMAGGGRHDLIVDAIRSVVDFVDIVCLADTGDAAAAVEVVREYLASRASPPKMLVFDCPNPMLDTGAARQRCIDFATEINATWAIMLDTDERIQPNGLDIRAWCAAQPPAVCAAIRADNGTYEKEKLFALPSPGKWCGRAHEYWDWRQTPRVTMPTVTFSEIPKAPGEGEAKAAIVVDAMRKQFAETPCARWAYYLGDALAATGKLEEAVDAWRVAESAPGAPEERAWSCMRMAITLNQQLHRVDDAYRACIRGIAIYSSVSELVWYAGLCQLRRGKPVEALYFARMALAVGDQKHARRVTFRVPKGFRDGPLEVIREASIRLGDHETASWAHTQLTGAPLPVPAASSTTPTYPPGTCQPPIPQTAGSALPG